MNKKTKIVATISDLRCSTDFIKTLYEAGMNVVRLNTAHQDLEASLKIIKNVREVSDKIPIMIDTKGPEIRTSAVTEKIQVKKDDIISVKGGNADSISTPNCIYVSYIDFAKEVPVGGCILIDDGALELIVEKIENDTLKCRVKNDGTIGNKKSVNVPAVSFKLPALNVKDKSYLDFAITNDIDFIAHSFVRNKEDIIEIQDYLRTHDSRIKVIAKIENQEGVDNIEEILDYAYGIMIARGDLGIEIAFEKIPGIQRMLINKCIERRKPVIVATQMLHSMTDQPRATRAEVSDVANAIFSCADAIMLSNETTTGKYPKEAVETMARIAEEVELTSLDKLDIPVKVLSTETSAFLSKSAVEAAMRLDAKIIIADTTTGRTIRNMSGFRGKKLIYAMCYDRRVARELALSFGVYAYFIESKASFDFLTLSLNKLISAGALTEKDKVVVLGGNFGTSHGASHIEISTVENLNQKRN